MNETEVKTALASGNSQTATNALVQLHKSGTLNDLKTVMDYFKTQQDPTMKKKAVKVASNIIKKNLITNYQKMPPKMRNSLAKLMGNIDYEVVNSIAKDLKSTNDEIRFHSICVLGLMGSNPRTRQLLEEMVKDRNEKVRATAVSLMKAMVERKDLTLITRMLKDDDERVVANTVETIESIKQPQLAQLLTQYKNHPNNRVRGNVLKALWNMGHFDIYKPLKEMAENGESHLMRTTACWVMGELFNDEDFEYLALLAPCLQDEEKLVRENAIKAFFKIGGEALDNLETANREEVEEVKNFLKMA